MSVTLDIGFECFGESEVQHFCGAIRRYFHIGGLQVAVDDAALVGIFQCFGNLFGDGQRILARQRALFDAVGKRGPIDQLHHQRRHVVGFFQAVDRGNIRMIERRENLCFALETRHALAVAGKLIREDFNGHVTAEACIMREINFAHASSAEQRRYLVGPQFCARGQTHKCAGL